MNKIDFVNELSIRSISVSKEQVDLLWVFMRTVLETNEKFNLTAIKDEDAFVEKMLFDSAILLNNQRFEDIDILDVGSGAGFPSVVLSILSPKAHVIALDATAKKVNFIKEFAEKHNLNLTAVCARAEEYAQNNREKYLIITARAVAELRVLLELVVPMLQVGGHFIAMKGPGFEEEISNAQCALKKLNCSIDYVYEDQLPDSKESRYMIYIKKNKETPKKYPRTFGEIKNKPL